MYLHVGLLAYQGIIFSASAGHNFENKLLYLDRGLFARDLSDDLLIQITETFHIGSSLYLCILCIFARVLASITKLYYRRNVIIIILLCTLMMETDSICI